LHLYTHHFREKNTYSSSTFPPVDPRFIRSNPATYVCALTWLSLSVPARSLARSLAAGRGEETQTRSRDEEKDSALRPRAAEVWNDREAQKKQKEKRRRKREDSGEDRHSERIEREAIRECLMPRTKLCNYLYVRLKTILTSASACAVRRSVLAVMRLATHSHTHTHVQFTYECCEMRAKKRADAREDARICVHVYVCASIYLPMMHHSSHLLPKAHERHISWAPIMPFAHTTTTSQLHSEPPDCAAACGC
jgi:hypothetical protein